MTLLRYHFGRARRYCNARPSNRSGNDSVTLTLTTRWDPSTDPATYRLSLVNDGNTPVENFLLGVSGPALGIGPLTKIDGATLVSHLSNSLLFAPPTRFVLNPGARWQVVIRAMTHPLRHWTDGARGAYLVLSDGALLDVATAISSDTELTKGAERFPVPADPPVDLSIVPWPSEVAVEGTREPPPGFDLRPSDDDGRRAADTFALLTAELFPEEQLIASALEGAMPVRLDRWEGTAGDESYEVAFEDAGARITAGTETACLYGLITLGQILRGARKYPGKLRFPARGRIADRPSLKWRGTHFDSARTFFPAASVSRFLAILAWNKMNRFHWHLSDDEGWRVEIDAFPELMRQGAWRGHGMAVPPLLGSGPGATGGYYSKVEIRKIVAHGRRLGIEIVPEIDMPGHCFAVLQSLPALRDPGETHAYRSIQGFPDNCLNPAHGPVFRFVETVIDEILDLFPFGTFHLGADEVPLAAWSGSPMALALLEELGGKAVAEAHGARANIASEHEEADAIDGSGAAILQAHFIGRVHRHLAGRGAKTGGWEEAGHGGVLDKDKSYLVGWRNVAVSAALAAEGYDIVVSPGQHYYLDMANGPDWTEPGAGWAGSSSPDQTYRFDPREGWSEAQLDHLLGVQSCIWSERITDGAVFDRLVFPRLSAVAETAWTRPEHKSWERFSALTGLMSIMYGNWRG